MRVHNFKYRKYQKIRAKKDTLDFKAIGLLYGFCGLRALESYRVTGAQLESARRSLKKVVKKLGDVSIRVEANLPVTKKPAEVRMGKGKGSYSHSVRVVKVGTILFELGGAHLNPKLAEEACLQASQRLPFKTEIVFFKN